MKYPFIFLFFFLTVHAQYDAKREKYLSQFMEKKEEVTDQAEGQSEEEVKREKQAIVEELSTRFGFKVDGDSVTLEDLKEVKKKLLEALEQAQKKSSLPPTPQSQGAAATATSVQDITKLTKEQLSASFAPYRSLPKEDSRKMLTTRLKNKPFVNHPKIIEFIDELIRRPGALENAVGLVKAKKEMVIYAIFFVITVILGFVYKRIHEKKKAKGLQRVVNYFSRFIIINALRLGMFVLLFNHYLGETFRVFFRVFF